MTHCETLRVETLSLTLPLLDVLRCSKSHKGSEVMKSIVCKAFRHCVGHYLICWDVLKDDTVVFDAFPNEVVLDVDVLCPHMVFRVLGESD